MRASDGRRYGTCPGARSAGSGSPSRARSRASRASACASASRVVHAGDQRVLERDPLALRRSDRLRRPRAASSSGKRRFSGTSSSRSSSRVACSEIASRTGTACAELGDLGHDPGGRHRDASRRERERVRVGQHADRLHHVRQVEQRLAHAHEHDVRERSARPRRGARRRAAPGRRSPPRAGCGRAPGARWRRTTQSRLQPICDETHSVWRRASGMITASMRAPSRGARARACACRRPRGASRRALERARAPARAELARAARAAGSPSPRSRARGGRTASCATCAARKPGLPALANSARSSSGVWASSGLHSGPTIVEVRHRATFGAPLGLVGGLAPRRPRRRPRRPARAGSRARSASPAPPRSSRGSPRGRSTRCRSAPGASARAEQREQRRLDQAAPPVALLRPRVGAVDPALLDTARGQHALERVLGGRVEQEHVARARASRRAAPPSARACARSRRRGTRARGSASPGRAGARRGRSRARARRAPRRARAAGRARAAPLAAD